MVKQMEIRDVSLPNTCLQKYLYCQCYNILLQDFPMYGIPDDAVYYHHVGYK